MVNAYALAFGGLLLGGRAGDLLGRRKMFIAGLLLFPPPTRAGRFATSQGCLLAARAIQGIGGAITARPRFRWSPPPSPKARRATGRRASTRR